MLTAACAYRLPCTGLGDPVDEASITIADRMGARSYRVPVYRRGGVTVAISGPGAATVTYDNGGTTSVVVA